MTNYENRKGMVLYMRAFSIVLSLFLLGGCATNLGDFEKMSYRERAEYVCNNHRDLRDLFYQVEKYDRGYTLHRFCKDVPVVVPGDISCSGYDYSIYCRTAKCIYCKTREYVRKVEVCEDIQVPIGGNIEEKELESTYNKYLKQLKDQIIECHTTVNKLNAEDAFRYYQSVK